MKFEDLRVGDILFYDTLGHPTRVTAARAAMARGGRPASECVSITHVAIVGCISGGVPWLAHISEQGLIFNPINITKYEYKGFAYLAYRMRYDEDEFLATTAGSTAKSWALLNTDAEFHRKDDLGSGITDFEDTLADPVLTGNVVTVKGAFNQLKPYVAAFRSSSFGSGARSYVRYLSQNCVTDIPAELKQGGGPFSGMFCSMFVIAAYQTVMGEKRSDLMLALDARTTLPWTFERYVRSRISWQRLGYLDYFRGLLGENIDN
ncbi:hypothetical protein ACWJJH_14280 [Endozoicomonadaceae bacterium StTr2]